MCSKENYFDKMTLKQIIASIKLMNNPTKQNVLLPLM